MLEVLRRHDPDLVELNTPSGGVIVTPGIQGRIFCHLGGRLVHRLDTALLDNPSPTDFNNFGGNSLWPAPEGGPFAFNYPPDGGGWRVQPAINSQNLAVTAKSPTSVTIEKDISLVNRKGTVISLKYRRCVTLVETTPLVRGRGVDTIAYRAEDSFIPQGRYSKADVLIAPWSLEQFPGAEGILAFAKVQDPKTSINADFYGSPMDRIDFAPGHFTFRLGGQDRTQIGVRVANEPSLIGAWDRARGILITRHTEKQPGVYFNMADNDQPQGPYSAADMYSIFNGGALDFFELETIGAMQIDDEVVAPSTLTSETIILAGADKEIDQYAGIPLRR